MKQSFTKSLALVLAFQFALGPVAYAQDFGTVAQGLLNATNQALSQQQGMNEGIMIEQRTAMLESQLDPRICNGSQPCTDPFFPACRILRRVPNLVTPDVCESNFNVAANPAGASQVRIELQAYLNTFKDISDKYETWGKTSGQANNEGVSCLEQSAARLDQDLAAAEKRVQDLIDRVTTAKTEFQRKTADAIAQIQEGQALLYGTSAGGRSSAILTQNSVKFADLFPNQCKTIKNNTELDADGRGGGLMSLQTKFYDKANETVGQGQGSFNAFTFDSSKASDLTARIRDIASRAGTAVTSGGLSALSTSTDGLTDPYGLLAEAKDSLRDIQKEAETFKQDLQNNQNVATNTQVSVPNDVLFGQNNSNFEQALNTAERNIKGSCFTGSGNSMSMIISGKLPFSIPGFNASSASKNSANTFQTYVQNVLGSSTYTIAEKLKLVQDLEKTGTNSQYQIRLPDVLTGPGFSYDKGDYVPVSKLVSDIVSYCEAQFNSTNGEKASPAAAIAQMRTLRSKYTTYVSSMPSKINNAITNRMINCVDNSTASAAGTNTCSGNALSTSNATFCVARAVTCATNMRNCYDLAQKLVTEKTQKRDVAVSAYKANVAVAKSALQGLYQQVKEIAKLQSNAISRIPGAASIDIPADAKSLFDYNPKTSRGKYLEGLDSLEVEDPEAFYTTAADNLKKIKDALKRQRDSVFKGTDSSSGSELAGGIDKHINSVKQAMAEVVRDINSKYLNKCERVLRRLNDDADRYDAESSRQYAERQSALSNLCANYNAVISTPGCEEGGIADLADTSQAAAQFAGSREYSVVRTMSRYCERAQSQADTARDISDQQIRMRASNACRGPAPANRCKVYLTARACANRVTQPATPFVAPSDTSSISPGFLYFANQDSAVQTACRAAFTGSTPTENSTSSAPTTLTYPTDVGCRQAINTYLNNPDNCVGSTSGSEFDDTVTQAARDMITGTSTEDDYRNRISRLGEQGTSVCAAQSQGLSIGNLGGQGTVTTGGAGAATENERNY